MRLFHPTPDVTEEPPGLLPHPDTPRESRDRIADRLREEGGQLPSLRPTVVNEVEQWIDPATVDNASYAEKTALTAGAHSIAFTVPPGKRMHSIVVENNQSTAILTVHPTGGTAGAGGPIIIGPGGFMQIGGTRTAVSINVPGAVQLNDPTTAGVAVYGKVI